MLTSTGGQTKPTNGFKPIPNGNADSPKTKPIVYARFTLEVRGGLLIFRTDQVGVVQNDTLDQVCDKRRGANPTGQVVTTPVTGASSAGGIPLGPTDIPINKACHVVIELDPYWAWQFRTADVGVTAKDDYKDSNWDLWHVNPTKRYSQDMPSENGCRLVYFDVLKRVEDTRQSFNLHVELIQDTGTGASVETIFDPDVPDIGGTFPLT